MYRVFDAYLGNPPRDWSGDLLKLYGGIRAAGDSASRRAEARRIPNTHPSLSLDRYAGTYADSLAGDINVSFESGKLRLRSSSTHAGTLEHWEYDTFRVRWDNAWEGTSFATFTIGRDGVPTRLDFEDAVLRRVERQHAQR
jgi:hypothetical protein